MKSKYMLFQLNFRYFMSLQVLVRGVLCVLIPWSLLCNIVVSCCMKKLTIQFVSVSSFELVMEALQRISYSDFHQTIQSIDGSSSASKETKNRRGQVPQKFKNSKEAFIQMFCCTIAREQQDTKIKPFHKYLLLFT